MFAIMGLLAFFDVLAAPAAYASSSASPAGSSAPAGTISAGTALVRAEVPDHTSSGGFSEWGSLNAGALSATASVSAEVPGVRIDQEFFSDAAFRQYVKDCLDLDHNDVLSREEIEAADTIVLSQYFIDYPDMKVSSLKGIEYLTELRYLDCSENSIAAADFSKNTKLENLICSGNELKELDLSHNVSLVKLNCSGNLLDRLDVSGCSDLTELNCGNNQLKVLDVTSNIMLRYLYCQNNQLKSLNILKCRIIYTVDCRINNFTELAVYGLNSLTALAIDNNVILIRSENDEGSAYAGEGDDFNDYSDDNTWTYAPDQDGDYEYGVVEKLSQSIRSAGKFSGVCGGKAFYLKAKAYTKMTYKSSDTRIASVTSKGKVKLKKPGTAKITITARESSKYKKAKKVVTVKSTLKKPSLKAVNISKKRIKLTWGKVPGADGYKLYIYEPSKGKYICRLTKKAKVKSVTHRGLSKGSVYKYKVRAFAKSGGKYIYSSFSSVRSVKVKK